jgi:hypothetical protein
MTLTREQITPGGYGDSVAQTWKFGTGEAIDASLLTPETVLLIGLQNKGFEALRIDRVDAVKIEGTNLLPPHGPRVYTRQELDAVRPIGVVRAALPWGDLKEFKEGGIYQAWPTGHVYTVKDGILRSVDGKSLRDLGQLTAMPALLPKMIVRWEPPTARTPRT